MKGTEGSTPIYAVTSDKNLAIISDSPVACMLESIHTSCGWALCDFPRTHLLLFIYYIALVQALITFTWLIKQLLCLPAFNLISSLGFYTLHYTLARMIFLEGKSDDVMSLFKIHEWLLTAVLINFSSLNGVQNSSWPAPFKLFHHSCLVPFCFSLITLRVSLILFSGLSGFYLGCCLCPESSCGIQNNGYPKTSSS